MLLPIWPNPAGSRGIESPAPLRRRSGLALATVRRAAALAFARILGLAAVVAGLAAALAFATILAFAAVLGRAAIVGELAGAEGGVAGSGLGRL